MPWNRNIVALPMVRSRLLDGNAPDGPISGRSGRTPLMLAAMHGAPAICRVLLEAGADPDRRDARGFTALFHAADNPPGVMSECYGILLRHGACPTADTVTGTTMGMARAIGMPGTPRALVASWIWRHRAVDRREDPGPCPPVDEADRAWAMTCVAAQAQDAWVMPLLAACGAGH